MKALEKRKKFTIGDVIITSILALWVLMVLIPIYNVLVISFTSEREYLLSTFLLYPKVPTLDSYRELFKDERIFIGYSTTLKILGVGLPINLLLTTSFAYGLSRRNYPGYRFFFYFVLITMIFNGGIIPRYILMKELKLTNTIWSVVLANSINTFYMIIMRNFFMTIPESLIESAHLDGAGEWYTLWRIILPLSMPIIATMTLFYSVDRWNEWYYAMFFIQKGKLQPLQLVLRGIVMDSEMLDFVSASGAVVLEDTKFSMGLKTAAIVCTMLPIMCVFPFLQRYFVKGVLIGSIKS